MEPTQITITTTVVADIDRVWKCWNNPEHITGWNFASPDWHCPSAENDLRPGGKLKSRMEAKDGSFGFDFEATYNEVVPMEKIVYTIADGRIVTTTFGKESEGVKVTTVFEAETQNPVDMQRNGWQAILNNFKAYVEKAA